MKQVDVPESFAAWRTVARQLLQENISPAQVLWSNQSEPGLNLFDNDEASAVSSAAPHSYTVPKPFLELAETVACHRDTRKWEILYRVLWKLTHDQPQLLKIGLDADVIQCNRMISAIRRDCHKMKAFVRFREVDWEHAEDHDDPCFVAWFEPEHLIVQRMAPFFKKRFANMRWSILTPDACAHWHHKKLFFTTGVSKAMAPEADDFEHLWLTYYKNIFNPARLKEKAMQSEMPKKYWKNLPEAALIPELKAKGKQMDLSREFDS